MTTSAHLSLPFLVAGQAQKHVTVNESLLRLDALVQLAVVSATTTAQPGSPSEGAVYILPAGKTGAAWGDMSNAALAYYRDGVWEEITPREGWLAYVKDSDLIVVYGGAAWSTSGVRTALGLGSAATMNTGTSGGNVPLLSTNNSRSGSDDYPGTSAFITMTVNGDKSTAGGAIRITTNSTASRRAIQFSDPGGYVASFNLQSGALITDGPVTIGGAGLLVGAPTGGRLGAGTINAQAVYDDNVLLTCGPVELLREGAIDLAKWDALAPDRIHAAIRDEAGQEITPVRTEPRRHEAMHHFAAMLDQGFDPRDAGNYCARLAADGAPPGLYTEAEWAALAAHGQKPDIGAALTRTFLALDCLAVAFNAALARIEALERR